MKLKKRFLFPLIYLVFLTLCWIGYGVFDVILFVLIILTLPTNLVYTALSYIIDLPRDGLYFVLFGAILQFFIIGYLYDVIAEYFHNKKYWDTPI